MSTTRLPMSTTRLSLPTNRHPKDMLEMVMAGVAMHDGDLSDDEKQIVEKGYKVRQAVSVYY